MSNQERKKSYLSIFEEIAGISSPIEKHNGLSYPDLQKEKTSPLEEIYTLTDELDHQILMHRDAHFGGHFDIMISYYDQKDHIGIYPEFESKRILYLKEIERQLGKNLAPLMLTGAEAEQVARSRRAYEKLKAIYTIEKPKDLISSDYLIADLILSESKYPKQEITAIVSQGKRMLPELLQIIKSEYAYSPLFPGYGYAPYFTILCLSQIKDPSTIIPLFEILGREIVFDEEVILDALRAIGEPAKQFLLQLLKGRPFTQDTTHAAFALTVFSKELEVAIAALKELQDPRVWAMPLLRSYLLYNTESIQGYKEQKMLFQMVDHPEIPMDFRKEIEKMIQNWI
ncbi:MAG: hypothetical protein R3E91_03670 [Chlamydiales bacterium]